MVYRALYGDSQVFCRPFFMFCETVDRPEFDYKGPRFRPIR